MRSAVVMRSQVAAAGRLDAAFNIALAENRPAVDAMLKSKTRDQMLAHVKVIGYDEAAWVAVGRGYGQGSATKTNFNAARWTAFRDIEIATYLVLAGKSASASLASEVADLEGKIAAIKLRASQNEAWVKS